MNFKTKLAATTVGLLTFGGSVLGISLASGTATAAPVTSTSPSTPTHTAETTTPGDPGPAVQSGPQSGPDSTAPDVADGVATEAQTPETGAPSDGSGGHQDPAGNADNQSTTEQ
jgi:hypothetical protein